MKELLKTRCKKMPKEETKNLWQRWDAEVEKFKNARKNLPPDTTIRQWQRYLMFIFMQELSKNVLSEKESLDSILDRIIEAIQVACGFKRVRVYLVKEGDKDKKKLYLYRTSKGHKPIIRNFVLEMETEEDDAVDTLLVDKEPLAVDNAAKIKLVRRKDLNIEGPYSAIPLLVENMPYGLICADTAVMPAEGTPIFSYPESREYFDTFARAIMAAIENREIFDQRNQKIKQLELVDKFAEMIQSETEKEKLLNALIEYSVNLVGAAGGHLKLKNKETGEWNWAAVYGKDMAPTKITKPKRLDFFNLVLKDRKALLINDLANHPLMKKNLEYLKKQNHKEYLRRLGNRKSALIVPLVKHTGEIIGVLDVHSKHKNKFSELDKENLLALVNSVIYAVDKIQQLDRQYELLTLRDEFLEMLKNVVVKAYSLNTVLEILRDSCYRLVNPRNAKIVCLAIKDPHSNELTSPSVKCLKAEKNCISCFKEKRIIKGTLNKKEPQKGKNDLAIPILLKDQVIGVLYLQGEEKIDLTENEKKILEIITNTAAILIEAARAYEIKIKQGRALYEAGQFTAKMRDLEEWFNPVMEKVMDIIGRENKNCLLVMVDHESGKERFLIKGSSDLDIEGEKIPVKDTFFNLEIPMERSLCGLVKKEKKIRIIHDVKENKKFDQNDPGKLPFFKKDFGDIGHKVETSAEVAIPLKIKEGTKEERIIGFLVIDSIIPGDFRELDLQFIETIADYLAIAIHNQRLYEERARYQEDFYSLDRSLALQAFMKSFIHDITAPVQEIRSQTSIMKIDGEAGWEENLDQLEYLSDKLLSSYDEVVKDFARPFSEPVTVCIREIIVNSLETVEKTRGLGIPIKGNFWNSDINIECYSVFIEMAFRAIINNAIRYSQGLEPRTRYLKIDVKSNNENNLVTISFESSTIERIPPEKLKEIFRPFVRIISKDQGHGLGLSLAFECINLHNGEIKAENVEGKSAVRFLITLPRNLKIKKEF
jgi:GAF domain-containing protein